MTKPLEYRLRRMFDGRVAVGVSAVSKAEGLWEAEEAEIVRAVPARRAEFAAGRRAARMALGRLGAPQSAIPVGTCREPLWPEGVEGSITHDAGVALAAVAWSQNVRGLGIDLTEAGPLPGEIRRNILCHEAEMTLDPLEERVAFSAKESLFKAFFPLVREYFGFEVAVVRPDVKAGTFEIALACPLGDFPAGTRFPGRVSICARYILTGISI